MELPPDPKEGGEVLKWARSVAAYLRSLRVTSFRGGRVRHSSSGTALAVSFPKRKAPVLRDPLEVYIDGDSIKVHPGVISSPFNSVTPTTIDGEADWTFEAQECEVYLKVVINVSNTLSVAELHVGEETPDPSTDGIDYTGYLRIATVAEGGGGVWEVTLDHKGSRFAAVLLSDVYCSDTLVVTRTLVWG